MALTQLLKYTDASYTAGKFALGYTNTQMTNAANQGNIVGVVGGDIKDYFSYAQATGFAGDLGGQSSTSMSGFIVSTVTGATLTGPFQHYNQTSLVSGTALMQPPIKWNESLHTVDDVVWGVYAPRKDVGFGNTDTGKIIAYSVAVNAPTSVASDNPDDNEAKQGLADFLGRIGSLYAGQSNGPTFTAGSLNNIIGPNGAIIKGMFITYSNKNGTWICYGA